MIIGSHILLYSPHAEADRAFFRDILNFPNVDAGHGWLIFRLPPAEAGIHPAEPTASDGQSPADRELLGSVLYLLCDDLAATIENLQAKKVHCSEVKEESWGLRTSILLPSGSQIGLYQPKHALAIRA
jgi:hypothetical protein